VASVACVASAVAGEASVAYTAVAVGARSYCQTSCFKAEEASFIDCYLAINFIKELPSYSPFISWTLVTSATRAATASVAEVHCFTS
jgi:hypothetical protein